MSHQHKYGKRYELSEIQIMLCESSKEKEKRERKKLWNTKLDQESLSERRGIWVEPWGIDWIRLGRDGKEHPCWRIAVFVNEGLNSHMELAILILGKGSHWNFMYQRIILYSQTPKISGINE